MRSTITCTLFTVFCLTVFLAGGYLRMGELNAQSDIKFTGKVKMSAGAEYSDYLQNMINSGHADHLKFNGKIPQNPLHNFEVITTIDGINFDEDAANAGFYFIPPDPHGAVGPAHLVSIVNTSIEWHTKAGVQEVSKRLGKDAVTHIGSFFEPLVPVNSLFDPKVIYDQHAGRFIAVALEKVSTGLLDDPGNVSRILVAVSDDSDPNGLWYYHAIPSKLMLAAVDGIHEAWADYPGLAVDEETVYITANMFRFPAGGIFVGSRVWILDKIPFYFGLPAVVSFYDHGTLSGAPTPYPTTQPAHVFGPMLPPGPLGTYLVSAGWEDMFGADYLNIIEIISPLAAPIFISYFVPLGGDIFMTAAFPDAPQAGSPVLIETNDNRALNAVWRAGHLWAVNTVIPSAGPDIGQVTAHWYRMIAPFGYSLVDQGDVGGEDIAMICFTFFPSIAVNSAGDVAIGFAASAPTIFAGAYYTGRLSTDPPGYTIPSGVVRPGLAPYVRTFGGPRNRWGDYSATCVDPSDDLTFYVFNEFADTLGTVLPPGEDGRWSTAWGVLPTSVLPIELVSFTGSVLGSAIRLKWSTSTEVNNLGFEVEKAISGRNDWYKIGFVHGSGNSNSPKEYSFIDKNIIGSGSFNYRLKQLDNDGKYSYSKVIEVKFIPENFALLQNYPNPFNPSTKISWQSPVGSHQTLKVFDVLGNEVATLVDEYREAGKYEVDFNGKNLATGMYIYKLQTGGFVETKKMILLR